MHLEESCSSVKHCSRTYPLISHSPISFHLKTVMTPSYMVEGVPVHVQLQIATAFLQCHYDEFITSSVKDTGHWYKRATSKQIGLKLKRKNSLWKERTPKKYSRCKVIFSSDTLRIKTCWIMFICREEK